MKSTLERLIGEAVREVFGISDVVFSVGHAELSHGDFATNVALIVGKRIEKDPKEVAQKIADFLREKHDAGIADISVAGLGFINFTLSRSHVSGILKQVADQKEAWGKSGVFDGKRIIVEHSSPNLFKPFHVGHMMNNAIGESIVRLARFSSAETNAISYPSDISLGIGKAVWAMLLDGQEKLESLQGMEEKIAYLGDCYVNGTRAFEEDEKVQAEAKAITKKLYDKTPGIEFAAYEAAKKINLDYFMQTVGRLGSYFDGGFIFESEAGETGGKIVRDNTPGVFEASDGAVIYRGEQDGLHTRVFINTEGYPTYEAKDIGLLALKFARFNPDRSILITDHQQTDYYGVVLTAAGKIEPDWKEKSVHCTHGRMTFKGQKMSSRLGGVPTAEAVLGAVKEEVAERSSELSDEAQDMIAIGALKFVILRAMAGKNINFDPDTSLSFEGDSGPYLQYTAVRAGAVLEKAKEKGLLPVVSDSAALTDLERLISRFPDIVEHSIDGWAPHHIVSYLLEVAQAFNRWYGNTHIIDESDPETPHRLAITDALRQTIMNGLWLLGIAVPERM